MKQIEEDVLLYMEKEHMGVYLSVAKNKLENPDSSERYAHPEQ